MNYNNSLKSKEMRSSLGSFISDYSKNKYNIIFYNAFTHPLVQNNWMPIWKLFPTPFSRSIIHYQTNE